MVEVTDSPDSLEVHERLREQERRHSRQRRLTTSCLVGPFVVLLLNLIPGTGDVVAAISFSLSGAFITLLVLSIVMGVSNATTSADESR